MLHEKATVSLDERASSVDAHPKPEHVSDDLTTTFDEVERKRVLRKLDVHLLPFVTVLYLLSFL